MTDDSSGILKVEHNTKEQRVFTVEQYFLNNEGLSATIQLLPESFPGCVISRLGVPRSCDFRPLDFFFIFIYLRIMLTHHMYLKILPL